MGRDTKKPHSRRRKRKFYRQMSHDERFRRERPFSKKFIRNFGGLILNKEVQPVFDKPNDELSDRMYENISKFIIAMGFKYMEIDTPDIKNRSLKYGAGLVDSFFNEKKISKEISPETKDLCKNYVEYGFFLRSLYGEKHIPISVDRFFSCLDDNKRLDPKKMGSELEEAFGDFEIDMSIPNCKYSLDKFDRFIDYTIGIKFRDRAEDPSLRLAAKVALEEVFNKYPMVEEGSRGYLKLALQHVESGMRSAYKSGKFREADIDG